MKPRIVIIGQGSEPLKNDVLKKAKRIGELLAENHCELFTGGSNGYPYEAVKGCHEKEGETVGISPAVNEEEHHEEYGFPTEGFTRLEFTGKGIPERNYDLIEKAEAIILVGGKIGTLNEFTLAYHKGKIIGILEGSGGIANMIQEIATVCAKNNTESNETENIIYSESPDEIVSLVLERLKHGKG